MACSSPHLPKQDPRFQRHTEHSLLRAEFLMRILTDTWTMAFCSVHNARLIFPSPRDCRYSCRTKLRLTASLPQSFRLNSPDTRIIGSRTPPLSAESNS